MTDFETKHPSLKGKTIVYTQEYSGTPSVPCSDVEATQIDKEELQKIMDDNASELAAAATFKQIMQQQFNMR